MAEWLFLTCSTRAGGNSETLARAAAAGLPDTAAVTWFDLAAPALPRFRDLRQRGGHRAPRGRLGALAQATLAADEIVIVTPIYWYGLAGPGHEMLDHWSGWLEVPQMAFADTMRGKRLWLISTRADAAGQSDQPLEDVVRRTTAWMGMAFGGALHGIGNEIGDIAKDRSALKAAAMLFQGVS